MHKIKLIKRVAVHVCTLLDSHVLMGMAAVCLHAGHGHAHLCKSMLKVFEWAQQQPELVFMFCIMANF